MKKTARILSAILAFATLFSATACDGDEKVKVGDDIWTVETVYAKAQELGFTGTWEEFRETMRGMDGVGIATVAVDEEGELIVTFSDGKNVKCGKVKGEACKHNYGGYTLGFAPTCESIGYNQRACRKCGDIDYKFLAPTGHDWQLLMPLEGDVSIFVCTKCNLTKADSNEGSGGGTGGESGSGDDDTKTVLSIGAVRNGQDRVWLENIAEHFEYLCQDVSFEEGKKGVDIKLDYTADPTPITTALQAGVSKYDVVYLPERYAARVPLQTVEDLSSLFASTVKDENKTIKDKMPAEYAAYANQGMAGCLPYTQEYCGIVYNAYLFEKYQWEVPNTTEELLALGAKMAQVNVIPMIHCGTDRGAYWEPILNLWTVQYDGVEAYREYLNNDVAALNQKSGRVKAISALQSFLTDDHFIDVRSWQASYSFVQAQTQYLVSALQSRNESPIAMMPNGEWMLSEMSDVVQQLENEDINALEKLNIKMMKTPVLSSIIELCPSIADDATLSKVIDAVDAGESSYTGVTQADFNRVKEARCLVETLDYGFQIAKSSTKKDLAKSFLAYLASDEGMNVAANSASVHLLLDYQLTSQQMENFDTLRRSCITDFSGAVTMPKEVFTKAFQSYGITTAYGLYSIQEINQKLFYEKKSVETVVAEVVNSLPKSSGNTQIVA